MGRQDLKWKIPDAAQASAKADAGSSRPFIARKTATPAKMTLRIAPKYWPRAFSFNAPSSAAFSHPCRPACSSSAIPRMRSALPGRTLSYSRKLEGGGSGPEKRAEKISSGTFSRSGSDGWGASEDALVCSVGTAGFFLCWGGFNTVVLNCFVHVPSDLIQILPHGIAGIPG